MTGQGSEFTSAVFTDFCLEHWIRLRHIGTEQHDSLGAGESYYVPLRRVITKVRTEFPVVPLHVASQCSVCAMNNTAGPNGLVPFLLLFGSVPRLPDVAGTQAIASEGLFSMMTAARKEYTSLVSQQRIRLGLNTYVTPAADYVYAPGDSVLVW